MKTENLDTLLRVLASKISTLPTHSCPSEPARGIKQAIVSKKAAIKLATFYEVAGYLRKTLEHKRAIEKQVWAVSGGGFAKNKNDLELLDIINLCEKIIMYYMLKGAGCEAEIAEHRDLDVIMEILK